MPYGCPLLPQDIFFDKPIHQALGQIRESKSAVEYEKAMDLLSKSGDQDKATLTLIGYKGGSLESQVNQDRAFVIDPYMSTATFAGNDLETNRLLGVFDGHAHLGEAVSEYSVKELPKLLAAKLSEELKVSNDEDEIIDTTKRILNETFVEIDKTAPAELSGGCTASVILQLGTKLFVANAGDSQSFVVAHRKSTGTTTIVYKSREDKPDLPDERARVETMGGSVSMPGRPGATARVVYTDKRTGHQVGLAMSRSIGDWEAGKVGVTAEPVVDVLDLPTIIKAQKLQMESSCFVVDEHGDMQLEDSCSTRETEDDVYIFAVSATDGLLDFIEPEIIANGLASSLANREGSLHLLSACESLISVAAQAWHQSKHGRYRDDIAIAVTTIRKPPNADGIE